MKKTPLLCELQDLSICDLKSVLDTTLKLIKQKQDKMYRLRVRFLDARKDLHPVCKQ